MKSNYYKAAVTLGVVTLGFLASYPFHATFLGGLISAGCGAAMIGGLADWFAVTALFRRPLGIRPGRVIRTEIIPRNRERIFSALVEMVENELLSKEVLKRQVDSYDVPQFILRYLDEHGGAEDVREALRQLAKYLLSRLEPQELGRLAGDLVKQNAPDLAASPLLGDIIEHALAKGYGDRAITVLASEGVKLVNHPQAGRILLEVVREALAAYERDMDRRKFVNGLLGVEPVEIVEEIQAKLREFLLEIGQDEHNPVRQALKQKLGKLAGDLRNDPWLQLKVEDWKNRLLQEKLDISRAVSRMIEARDMKTLEEYVLRSIDRQYVRFLDAFRQDEALHRKLDAFVKNLLAGWIDSRHGEIGALVRSSLDRLSNAKLVELIEAKAGNDLQIIRINGSVVGGLAGAIIYLLTFWLS